MKHRYLPMTEQDQKDMLDTIGVSSIDELFSDIPEKVRFKGQYNIKAAKSESSLLKELSQMAAKNADNKTYASFLGAGVTITINRLLRSRYSRSGTYGIYACGNFSR
jgi:glycine dehydrogenase subunit 1